MDQIGGHECPECGATGLRRDSTVGQGCAVICRTCKGTGRTEKGTQTFTGRKILPGVQRVFHFSVRLPGGFCSLQDVTLSDGTVIPWSQYGVPYEDWRAGAQPKHAEAVYCPWSATLSLCPEGKKCPTSRVIDCPKFPEKASCWAQWHAENDLK